MIRNRNLRLHVNCCNLRITKFSHLIFPIKVQVMKISIFESIPKNLFFSIQLYFSTSSWRVNRKLKKKFKTVHKNKLHFPTNLSRANFIQTASNKKSFTSIQSTLKQNHEKELHRKFEFEWKWKLIFWRWIWNQERE